MAKRSTFEPFKRSDLQPPFERLDVVGFEVDEVIDVVESVESSAKMLWNHLGKVEILRVQSRWG